MAEYSLERMNELNKRSKKSPTSPARMRFGSQAGGTSKCGRCSKTVYEAEKVPLGGDIVWHKHCLRCCLDRCNRQLSSSTFTKVGDEVFCASHAAEAERIVTHHKLRKPQGPPSPVVRGDSTTPVFDRDNFFQRSKGGDAQKSDDRRGSTGSMLREDSSPRSQNDDEMTNGGDLPSGSSRRNSTGSMNGTKHSHYDGAAAAHDEVDESGSSDSSSDHSSESEESESEDERNDANHRKSQPEVEDDHVVDSDYSSDGEHEDVEGYGKDKLTSSSRSDHQSSGSDEQSTSRVLLRSNSESNLPPSILKQPESSSRRKSMGDSGDVKEKSVTFALPDDYESSRGSDSYGAQRKRAKGHSSSNSQQHHRRSHGSSSSSSRHHRERGSVEDLREKLTAERALCDQLSKDIEEYDRAVKEIIDEKHQIEKTNASLKNLVDQMSRESEAQSEVHIKLTEELKRAQAELEARPLINATKGSTNSQSNDRIHSLEQELEAARKQNKVLTDDMSRFADYYTEIESKCADLEDQLKSAQQQSVSHDDHDALNRLRLDYDEAIAALEAGKEASVQQEAENDKLKKQIANLKKENSASSERLVNVKNELEHVKQQVPALKQKHDEVSQQLSLREAELRAALDSVNTSHENGESLIQVKGQLSHLEELLDQAQAQVKTLLEAKAKLESDLSETKQTLSSQKVVESTLKSEVERLNSEMDEVSALAVQAEQQSQQEIADLKSKIHELHQQATSGDQNLRDEVHALKIEKDVLQRTHLEQVERLMKAIEDAKSRELSHHHSTREKAKKHGHHHDDHKHRKSSDETQVDTPTSVSTVSSTPSSKSDSPRSLSSPKPSSPRTKTVAKLEGEVVSDNSPTKTHEDAKILNGTDQDDDTTEETSSTQEVSPELVNEFMEALTESVQMTVNEKRVLKAGLMNSDKELTVAAEHWNDTGDKAPLLRAVAGKVRARDLMKLVNDQQIDEALDTVCDKVPLSDQLIDALEQAVVEKNEPVLKALENWAVTQTSRVLVQAITEYARQGDKVPAAEDSQNNSDSPKNKPSSPKLNPELPRDTDALLLKLGKECKLSDAETNLLGKALAEDSASVAKVLEAYAGPASSKMVKDAIATYGALKRNTSSKCKICGSNGKCKHTLDTTSKRVLRRKSPSSSGSTPSSTKSTSSRGTKLSNGRRPLSTSSLRHRGGRSKSRSRHRRRSLSDSSDDEDGRGGVGMQVILFLAFIMVFFYLSMSM